MRDNVEILKRLLEEGTLSSRAEAIRGIDDSMRATEIILGERMRELAKLKKMYVDVKAERDALEEACKVFHEWFVRRKIPLPVATIRGADDRSVGEPAVKGAPS